MNEGRQSGAGNMEPKAELPVESSSTRLGDIQGLRALAVLLVVVYHAGLPLPGGFVGVDVFFVISGFVITSLLVRDLRSYGRIRFLRFYTRRVRRLLPALGVVLVFTATASAVLQSPLGAQQDTAVTGLGASVWLANGALYVITGGYFDNAADSIPLLHTWSLAVEEQFYLVFPALLLTGFLLGRRRRGLVGAATAVTVVLVLSFGLSLWLSYGNALPGVAKTQTAAFYLAPTRAWEFGVGALVALWATRGSRAGRALSLVAPGVGVLMLITSAVATHSTTPFPGLAALLPVVGTALLILAGRGRSNPVSRALSARPLQWIGDLSYSWYLWHWPFIVFADLIWPDLSVGKVCAALVSLGAAWLCYTYVEQPIRHRVSPSPLATLRIVAVSVVAPLVLFAGLYGGASKAWGNDRIASMNDQVGPEPAGYAEGCHTTTPISQRDIGRCTWNADAPGAPIYLLGDSNGVQYSDGLIAAGRALNRPVVVATMGGCPFIDVTIIQSNVKQVDCWTYVSDALAWLQRQPDGTVVTAAANEAINQRETEILAPGSSRSADAPSTKAAAWQTGLASVLRRVSATGHQPLSILTIPHFGSGDGPYWNPAECPLPELWKKPGRCGVTKSRGVSDTQQQLGLAAERTAVKETRTPSVNLRDKLCRGSAGECATNTGNSWIYRDGLHITTRMSRELAPDLVEALRRGDNQDD